LPPVSKAVAMSAAASHRPNMAANTAQPCFWFLAKRPNVYVRANGVTRMANRCRKFVNPFGFSKGWAALAFSGPPPLVPSSLMDSWLANGPPAMAWLAPSSVRPTVKPWRFWITPWLTNTSANTKASGTRMRVVARVRSTQKLPTVAERRRVRPRIRAIATARPTPADTKFWTARPVIWVRCETVFSGA
jgi:hypothetical protein